jgi:recombinational DNA repair ATPase RecF
VKITRLELEGFRCFREKKPLLLKDGRSLCLLGENGRGKSSIADALEFWSTGDVAWTHRDGVGLSALIHLEHTTAKVEVRIDGIGVASRTLKDRKAGNLEVGSGPLAADFEAERIPMLGHRTMAQFVDKTANDKRTELLEALGLEALGAFRSGISSVKRKLVRLSKEAQERFQSADSTLQTKLNDKTLETALSELSSTAQLKTKLTNEDDLIAWKPPPMSSPLPNSPLALIEELYKAREELAESSTRFWSEAVSDHATAAERSLSALLEAGRSVLAKSDDDRCPLCLVEQDRAALLKQIEERAVQLAAADEKFRIAVAELDKHEAAVNRLVRAVDALLGANMTVDDNFTTELRDAANELGVYKASLTKARADRSALPNTPILPSSDTISKLRESVLTTPSEVGPALIELSELKGLVASLKDARQNAIEVEQKTNAATAAEKISDKTVEKAIQAALDRINEPLAKYYGLLVNQPMYGDVGLTYTQGRVGGIDFQFRWNEKKDVRPAQRVMSESELNALGLALFLARLRVEPPSWRTMVLDDVVASFDVVHRTRLLRLLVTEFADWQVILLTHDPQLSRAARTEAPNWLDEKVTAWTPQSGPSFGPGEMRARLKERLDAGEPAEELGGMARLAIEEAMERPIQKMGLKIRYDRDNVYTADEYRRALIDGLRVGKFPRADAEILKRLATDGSVSSRACHFRDHEPGVTEQDLRVLLDDLADLDRLFECQACNKKVWEVIHQGSTRCQCICGELSCA